MTFLYCGHHKSGSTWIWQLVSRVCAELGLQHEHFHSEALFDYDLARCARQRRLDFLSYTSADSRYVDASSGAFKGFHVIRDPRDILVSAYFSHLNSHGHEQWPELAGYRSQLQAVDQEQGLVLTMAQLESLTIDGVSSNVFEQLRTWNYRSPHVLELKFERMIGDPYAAFFEVFEFLQLLDDSPGRRGLVEHWLRGAVSRRTRLQSLRSKKIPLVSLAGLIRQADFKKLSGGRPPGQEDAMSHYRKGVAGDWKNFFTPCVTQAFAGKYGDLLVQLGYEGDMTWCKT